MRRIGLRCLWNINAAHVLPVAEVTMDLAPRVIPDPPVLPALRVNPDQLVLPAPPAPRVIPDLLAAKTARVPAICSATSCTLTQLPRM